LPNSSDTTARARLFLWVPAGFFLPVRFAAFTAFAASLRSPEAEAQRRAALPDRDTNLRVRRAGIVRHARSGARRARRDGPRTRYNRGPAAVALHHGSRARLNRAHVTGMMLHGFNVVLPSLVEEYQE
jgi:hypothetical protein